MKLYPISVCDSTDERIACLIAHHPQLRALSHDGLDAVLEAILLAGCEAMEGQCRSVFQVINGGRA